MLTNQSIGYMDAPVPKDLDLKEAIDKRRMRLFWRITIKQAIYKI